MGPARRIVSLVPSLTEAVWDLGGGDRLVGVSDYCCSPTQAQTLPRVGGPRTPDHQAVAALRPDLVILSEEECCREDFERFTRWCDVYTARCASFDDALVVLTELGARLGVAAAAEAAVERARAAADRVSARSARVSVFYPVWADPWMTVTGETFAGDMLRLAGGRTIFDEPGPRYPSVTLEEVARRDPERILLPDEPYAFGPSDRARLRSIPAAAAGRIGCVPGRWAAWYGTRMNVGLEGLRKALRGDVGG